MEYIRIFILVVAVALTFCFGNAAKTYAAEENKTTESETTETVTQENTQEDTSTETNNNNSNIIYVVFIGSALLGSLVALALWITFKS